MGENSMRYERRYVQFNDLVFDDVDMLGEYDNTSSAFKLNTTDWSGAHGSYVAFKKPYLYAKESSVSIRLTLHMKKLSCEQRPFYRDFAVEQLSKPGKLWAVQNNELIWAFAVMTNYSESTVRMLNAVEMDIDFELWEGVWHKADSHKTFLQPYNVCTYLDCFEFKQKGDCDCCRACVDKDDDLYIQMEECCCVCDIVTKDMALCSHWDDLQDFYDQCTGEGFHIVYDCEKGEQFFAEAEYLGHKLCSSCGGTIAGRVYSDTSIPTENVTVVIHGKAHNPQIDINDNMNWIEGDFDGTLFIYPNGDVVFNDGCCDTTLAPSKWKIPSGMDYGWVINPRNNKVIVDLGECCGTACVYLQVDALTI